MYVGERVRDRATVVQKKTGRPVQVQITEQTRPPSANGWLQLAAERSDICFQAAFDNRRTSRLRSMPASSINGWSVPASMGRPTAHSLITSERSGTDLQEDRQPRSGAAAARTHHTGKRCPLSRDRVDDALAISEQVQL